MDHFVKLTLHEQLFKHKNLRMVLHIWYRVNVTNSKND